MANPICEAKDHTAYLHACIDLARQAPALPTNFRVGAILVHEPSNTILSTGYTNELPGNTHAEQVCLTKLAQAHGVNEDSVRAIPEMQLGQVILYTTVEPCTKRLSGNEPCAQRILNTKNDSTSGISTVYVGVHEPDTFVQGNDAKHILEKAGTKFEHITGMEDEILEVATAGHKKS